MIRETLRHSSTNGSAADRTLARSGKIIMNRHDTQARMVEAADPLDNIRKWCPHLRYVYEETSAATAES